MQITPLQASVMLSKFNREFKELGDKLRVNPVDIQDYIPDICYFIAFIKALQDVVNSGDTDSEDRLDARVVGYYDDAKIEIEEYYEHCKEKWNDGNSILPGVLRVITYQEEDIENDEQFD